MRALTMATSPAGNWPSDLPRLLGLEGSTASYFTDVVGREDCFGAVGALYEAKLLTGADCLAVLA